MIQVWFTQNRRGIIILYFFSSYLESPADHKMICVFWIRWRTKPLLFDNCLETRSIYFEKNFKMQQILHTQVSSWSFSFSLPKETNKIYYIYIDRLIHPDKLTWNTDMEVCFDISPPAPRSFEHTVAVAESAATGTGARPTARCPTAAGERSWNFQPGRGDQKR